MKAELTLEGSASTRMVLVEYSDQEKIHMKLLFDILSL